jgi:hypothetical protein
MMASLRTFITSSGVISGIGLASAKNQWPGRHAGHHFGLEHTARRKSQKHVGAVNGLGQRALAGGLRVDGLVGIHQLGAAFVNQAFDVGHPDVLAGQAQLDQQANAGQGCSAGAAGDQLDFSIFLPATSGH